MTTTWSIRGNAIGSSDVVSMFPGGEYTVARDMPVEDAWLIAAAPDLFDALANLIADFADAEGELIDKAKAALAKARGEQQS